MRRPALAVIGLGAAGGFGLGVPALLAACRQAVLPLQRQPQAGLPLSKLVPSAACRPISGSQRSYRLALAVADEALRQAALAPEARQGLGLVVGTCTGGMSDSEQAYLTHGEAHRAACYRFQPMHVLAERLRRRLRLGGPVSTHSLACASGAAAVVEAAEWLQQGLCQQVLVVGADALTRVTMAGFYSLRVIDAEGCRPFTRTRAGMNLGDGAGALLLCQATACRQPILAYLRGCGLAADAHHPTAPQPQARGLQQAIATACRQAGIASQQLTTVNAHGTGTIDNDACEAVAIAALAPQAAVYAPKRLTGHSMGAAALLEAVLAVAQLQEPALVEALAPPVAERMPELPPPPGPLLNTLGTQVLSTSLAFGGANAALIFADQPGAAPATVPATRPVRLLAASAISLQPGGSDKPQRPAWAAASSWRRLDPLARYACQAVDQLCGGAPQAVLQSSDALLVGTAFGAVTQTKAFVDSLAAFGDAAASPSPFTASVNNACAGSLGQLLHLRGPCTTISQGETTTAATLRLALLLLAAGEAERALVVIGDCLDAWSAAVVGHFAPRRLPIGSGVTALLLHCGAEGRRLRLGATSTVPALQAPAGAAWWPTAAAQLLATAPASACRLAAPPGEPSLELLLEVE